MAKTLVGLRPIKLKTKKDGDYRMGIFIYMSISKSVTHKEWEEVYQETLRLVRAFPLAERREVLVRGIPTTCLVPTEEREEQGGWLRSKTITGWFADGDYEYLRTAEEYFLDLMTKSPEERCRWLARTNRWLLLRDKDWAKIYDDIVDCPESFGRYYPMVRVKADSEGLRCMLRAFAANDVLYSYVSELVADQKSQSRKSTID